MTRNLLEAGRYFEADPLNRDSLVRCKIALGPEHPVTLESQLRLGDLLSTTSRSAEAEPLLRGVLVARERALGSDHPLTLQILPPLAKALSAAGKQQEADSLYDRWATGMYAQTRKDGTLALDDAKALLELDKHISFLSKEGDFEAAIQLCRKALAAREKQHGVNNPETIGTLAVLGTLLRDAGRTDEAESKLREVIKRTVRRYRAKSKDLVLCAEPLAVLLSDSGRFSEAEVLIRGAIASAERMFGSAHPVLLECECRLAVLLQRTGRLVEAELLFRKVLVVAKEHGQALYSSTIEGSIGFARLLQDTGRKEEAEAFLRQMIAQQEALIIPNDAIRLRANKSLASLLADRGRVTEAELIYRRVHAAMVRAHGTEHPDALSCLIDLGAFLNASHRSEEAESLLHRALGSPTLANIPELYCRALWCAGRITRSQGRAEEAVFLFKCAVNAAQSLRRETARINRDAERAFLKTLAVSYRELADFLISLNRIPEAEEILGLLKEEELHIIHIFMFKYQMYHHQVQD